MKKFKHLAGCLALCAAFGVAGGAVAQDDRHTTVQDGIEVRPLSRLTKVVPAETVNQAAAQQYTQMMSQAQQKGVLLPPSHPEVQRLRAIAQRIIPHSARWNQEASRWQWQVNVIDSKDVNAFCMPGGRIGFFTGILTSLKLTDDEVAAVMGHEIAHALREHSREKMAKQGLTNIGARLTGLAASAIFGVDPSFTGSLANAGYDPRAGIALWRKMAALSQRAPIELLSTHPGGESRINDMQAHMNVLLPVYARTKGTTAAKLPPYRSNVALR